MDGFGYEIDLKWSRGCRYFCACVPFYTRVSLSGAAVCVRWVLPRAQLPLTLTSGSIATFAVKPVNPHPPPAVDYPVQQTRHTPRAYHTSRIFTPDMATSAVR